MMKLGVSSYAFGWAVNEGQFTPDSLLDFAIAHQVPVIQLGDHLPLHRMETLALDTFAARARAAGVGIETGARGLTPAHLQTYIDVSHRVGAGLLRFVIDDRTYEPGLDEITCVILDALAALRDAGVTLGLENHDRFPTVTLRRLIDGIASENVGICLDTANSLGAGEGICEVLAQLAPVCVNLHVKDFAIARLPHLMGFIIAGRTLGEGMLPLREVLEAVARHGRCGTAVVETWPPPEANLAATIAKEADWAVRSVQVLRDALPRASNVSKVRSPKHRVIL
jgi:sugar phosphate isomerase/epimerase